MPRLKRFLSEIEGGLIPQTIWGFNEVGHTQEATQDVKEVFGERTGVAFPTPKPVRLIHRVLQVSSNSNDLILDAFSGSGTTGHATLQTNKEDGGDRRFILVEMETKIAREITAERVKRVAQGYTNAKGEQVEGLGGGFRFCELGEPLFDQHGQIRDSVTFADLARHVYFTETGEPLPDRSAGFSPLQLPHAKEAMDVSSRPANREAKRPEGRAPDSPFLGECRGVGVYLLFNGILGDKSANGGNILTRAVLAKLPKFDGPKVIYASGCLLGRERLQAGRITFRQTPYEIKVA